MRQQLTTTLDFDGDNSYSSRKLASLKKLSGKEWKVKELESIQHDIEYHSKEHDKEVERVNSRNIWLKQLRESIADLKAA